MSQLNQKKLQNTPSIENLFAKMQTDLGQHESHKLKSFYETMSQQIKGIYSQNGESIKKHTDPSEKILKQKILLSMIKAQQ